MWVSNINSIGISGEYTFVVQYTTYVVQYTTYVVTLTHKCGIVYHICGTHKFFFFDFDNFSKNFPTGILKKFFWILIVRIISEFWAQESLSKSQKNIFVCTTYVVQYTTFVGQSYHICGILYHKRGILYHKREFPGNPYTEKGLDGFVKDIQEKSQSLGS